MGKNDHLHEKTCCDDSDDDSWLRRDDNYDPSSARSIQTELDVDCLTPKELQEHNRKTYQREYRREYRKRKREQNTGNFQEDSTVHNLYILKRPLTFDSRGLIQLKQHAIFRPRKQKC